MKAKLIVNGREIEVDIPDNVAEQMTAPVKKTGYERVEKDEAYLFVDVNGKLSEYDEDHSDTDDNLFEIGNYYSDYTVATNNARADTLMRQLRRFAVEHRKKNPDWRNAKEDKYIISFDYEENKFFVSSGENIKEFGSIAFDFVETAHDAITTYSSELLWYFTEYKDSL